jgi:DNA-binding NtrC family response regulator
VRERRYKVLIVDDSDLTRDVVCAILDEHGYEAVALESPLGVTRVLAEIKPDMVLMDVNMPALRGDKLVEIVNRHGVLHCPLVLFSDRPAEELARLVAQCGASGYIQKTGDAGALVRDVERMLHARSTNGSIPPSSSPAPISSTRGSVTAMRRVQ